MVGYTVTGTYIVAVFIPYTFGNCNNKIVVGFKKFFGIFDEFVLVKRNFRQINKVRCGIITVL